MIEDDKDNDGLFPEDYRDKYPVPFEFEAKTTSDNIYVKKKDIFKIETRWNLNTSDSVLDTEFPQEYDGEEIEGNPVMEVDDDRKPDGRKTRHEKKREDILGVAFVLAMYKHKECIDSSNKITAAHIANVIRDNAFTFWKERSDRHDDDVVPLKSKVEKLLSEQLNRFPEHNSKQKINFDDE